MLTRPIIQIAGVIDRAEADMLVECGARYLGFPLRLPVHRPDLSEADAAAIIRDLPADVHAVAITYLDRADDVIDFCRYLGVRAVQLHGDIDVEELRRIKETDGDLAIIKSLVVGSAPVKTLESMVDELQQFVDAFITDTFDPATGASGATGKTHDWAASERLVRTSSRPVILAGGLTPDNVFDACAAVRPAGVDAHTGVEGSDGRKSRDKVERFLAEALRGFAALDTSPQKR